MYTPHQYWSANFIYDMLLCLHTRWSLSMLHPSTMICYPYAPSIHYDMLRPIHYAVLCPIHYDMLQPMLIL